VALMAQAYSCTHDLGPAGVIVPVPLGMLGQDEDVIYTKAVAVT
jgi:hypothetical protein